jgi:thymidylate synthase (FAD)
MIKVLDHGYIKLVESWGSEERIIEAARMSTDGSFRQWEDKPHNTTCPDRDAPLLPAPGCRYCNAVSGDERLLRRLWKMGHLTPFEMAGAIVEIQAPIMVFREWVRHRTQSFNELSARYTPMPDLNYVPTIERCMLNSLTNKQAGRAKGAEELTEEAAGRWLSELKYAYELIEQVYQNGLQLGVPKEVARLPVPVGRYSRMRASANLRNWLAFLTLRMDNAAQWEIRQYANELHNILQPIFPRTLALFAEIK